MPANETNRGCTQPHGVHGCSRRTLLPVFPFFFFFLSFLPSLVPSPPLFPPFPLPALSLFLSLPRNVKARRHSLGLPLGLYARVNLPTENKHAKLFRLRFVAVRLALNSAARWQKGNNRTRIVPFRALGHYLSCESNGILPWINANT